MTAERIVAVLAVDTVESTALRTLLGHERMDRFVHAELEALSEAATACGGTILKTLGDGLMASFDLASAALAAATAMQRAVASLADRAGSDVAVQLRIGVAASDVSLAHDDIRGLAPIEAARLEAAAAPGETLCTEAVRLLSRGRGGHRFESLGMRQFKGLDEPLLVHRLLHPLADLLGMPESLDQSRRYDFVGRQAERRRLRQAWDEARQGGGGLVVLSGEPGIGKTRLCRELALDVRRTGGVVLHGRCAEHTGFPYEPFVQPLRRFLGRADDLSGPLVEHAAELVRILPELRRYLPDLRPVPISDADAERQRLFDAVTGWLVELTRRGPVLLVLDDVSWIDQASLRLLRHLEERIATEAVLVVASYRPGDAVAHARTFVREHGRRRPSHQLVVGGIEDDDTASLAAAVLGGPLDPAAQRLARDVSHSTGGNPLFFAEVLRSLSEQGTLQATDGRWTAAELHQPLVIPPGAEGLIRDRVERLPAVTRRLLDVASVIGFSFPVELLIEVLGLAPVDVVEALDAAVDANVVHSRTGSDTYEFTHSMMREAIYGALSPVRRAAEHHRVAETAEQGHGRQSDSWAEFLAYQFEHGLGQADSTKAVLYYQRAGRLAESRLAHDQAIVLYRRALDLLANSSRADDDELRCDLLLELGTAERRAGRDARKTLLVAAESALQLKDPDRAARAVLGTGRGIFSCVGEVDQERIAALNSTLELVGTQRSALRARLLAALSAELTFDPDGTRPERASDEALAIARELDEPATTVTVIGFRLVALWRADRLDERLALGAELDELRRLAGDQRSGRFLSAMTVYCQAQMEAGDLERADLLLRWIEATAQTLRQPATVGYAHVRLASRACLAGDLAEAERLADEAYLCTREAGQPDAEAFHVGQLLGIRLHQGRLRELRDRVDWAVERYRGVPAFLAAAACVAAETGDEARCRAALERLMAGWDELVFDLNWLTTAAFASVAAAYLDDRAAAGPLREMIGPYRDQFVDNAVVFLGSVQHYHGMLSAVLGRHDEAEDAFREALAAHERLASPPLVARTLLEFAAALGRRPDPPVARVRQLAERAAELGRRHGYTTVNRRSRALLTTVPPA